MARREKFEKLVTDRLIELNMNRSALSERLKHGPQKEDGTFGDEGNKLGKWFRGRTRPRPEDVRDLARELHLNQIEVFVSLGWLDDKLLPVALRSVDTIRALAEGLRAFESTLEFMPISGGTIADAAAKNGNWEVTLVPKHHTVAFLSDDRSSSEVKLHLDDIVGLAPIDQELDADAMRHAVLRDFSGVLRRTGGMPEDDQEETARYDAEYCPKSTRTMAWIRVPRLMAERAPSRSAVSLDPIRSIAIIGGHWGGQDDVAAMLASALGWGYVNTSFAAMNLFGRNLSNSLSERDEAQLVHNYNAALVARTLDGMTGFADQRVWAHGSPGSIVEVAKLLADSRSDQFVIYFKPNEACNRMAQEATSTPVRPDAVDADAATRAGEAVSEILAARKNAQTAVEIEIDEQVFSDGFSHFVKQLRSISERLGLHLIWRHEEPRDRVIGELLRAREIL